VNIWRFAAMGLGGLLALGLSVASQAACEIKGPENKTSDQNAAKIRFGRVNMTHPMLQPPGTLLDRTVVPAQHFTYMNPDAVLWECNITDIPAVHFMVATNGDEKVGGYWDIGGNDGLSDVYATWWQYVGIRLTMSGVPLTRRWKAVALTSYLPAGNKARIRVRDIPDMVAELYRVSRLPPGSGAVSDYCWTGSNNADMGKPSPSGTAYTCNQPSAYIQLAGPGMGDTKRDYVGEDSAYNYQFFGEGNGFGYTLANSGTVLSNNASCVLRNNTPTVTFPALSAQQLMQGAKATQNFSVLVECVDGLPSGVNSGQTAIGFEVSPGANHGAIVLLANQNLVTPEGGVTHLVDDCYGCPGRAQGVAVTLQNPALKPGGDLVFVRYPGWSGGDIRGQNAGWYPVLTGTAWAGNPTPGFTYWNHTFTATLGRIKNMPVTAGSFSATATILVKVQ